jgi:FixJ family two-component response regulator
MAIAHHLDIAIKTVEVHRSRVMEMLGATTVADLIALSKAAEMA